MLFYINLPRPNVALLFIQILEALQQSCHVLLVLVSARCLFVPLLDYLCKPCVLFIKLLTFPIASIFHRF